MSQLTPRQIVKELDRYIIGQEDAKRAVAVALRNRYRRAMLDEAMRREISPKNILMIGPTGVGKTEIARRLARIVDAPFLKVEATKFTEVGYVGRDVDSIVRDLVEAAIRMVKEEHGERVRIRAQDLAEERIVELLTQTTKKAHRTPNPIDLILGNKPKEQEVSPEERQYMQGRREEVREKLAQRELEDHEIEIEVEETSPQMEIQGMAVNLGDMMGGILPKRMKQRRVKISEARRLLGQEEESKLIDMDAVTAEAIQRAEQDGIVFIDEIDKVAGRSAAGHGPDVSREGVQRDILPIVEGSTVMTKYGPVRTDYMLFIAAGAFHVAKVKDLIPELQGRFPVRVTLKSLTKEDFRNILFQPENALTRQYAALLGVDHVNLAFEDSSLDALAEAAYVANENGEDIGARRLVTIFETLLEDIAFNAGDDMPDVELRITGEYVRQHLSDDAKERDLRQFII
ncbi:MAG: ATP-dependent protease ATPase subunit HslU [Oscillospiraceae bacterium]|jgi:ATP-dependent HslUV protease ATP-binding subunit HslU|nr:ATP-dependent protease ATPase subunit HslU [Oscillospiraceae bacterium]